MMISKPSLFFMKGEEAKKYEVCVNRDQSKSNVTCVGQIVFWYSYHDFV